MDPDGRTVWDIADLGFFAYSAGKFAHEPSWSNARDLGLDAIGLLPVIPSLGAIKRVGQGIDKINEGIEVSAIGAKISKGHAFEKHVLQMGEFPGIQTREQFASEIERIINNPSAMRQLKGGRTAYWDEGTGTVIIHDPKAPDGGTAFKPELGKKYFTDKLQ